MKQDQRVDLLLRTYFLTTEEGGRKSNVGRPGARDYRYPIDAGGPWLFDARIWLNGRELELGETYDLQVALLDPDNLRWFAGGKQVTLWEGRTFARCEVLKVFGPDRGSASQTRPRKR